MFWRPISVKDNPLYKSFVYVSFQLNFVQVRTYSFWLTPTHRSGKSVTIRESNHGSGVCHSGKSATIRESNHGLVERSIKRSAMYQTKSSILLAGTGLWKISSVACGFSSIKIEHSLDVHPWSDSTEFRGIGRGSSD